MNREKEKSLKNVLTKVGSSIKSRKKELILLVILLLALVFVAWKILGKKDSNTPSSQQWTESEVKVMQILREIDGVGDASVMVCETEEGVTGVVVVCEGAKDFRVITDVREAVATALGTDLKSVKIYLKEKS